MCLRSWLQHLALVLVASASILLFSSSAIAADRVVLKYRVFSEPIRVKELTTFAETGELSTLLRINFALARQDPEVVRQYLTEPVKVNSVLLDRLLNNPIGNVVLDEVSQVVHTPSRQADREGLRSALVLSVSSDNNISLIEAIQNYPTAVVQLEGDRLESAYRQISQLEGRLQNLLAKFPQL